MCKGIIPISYHRETYTQLDSRNINRQTDGRVDKYIER